MLHFRFIWKPKSHPSVCLQNRLIFFVLTANLGESNKAICFKDSDFNDDDDR